jgi:hypothetical protein
MRIGMLWFNNNHKQSFAEKCEGAIAYYTAKYGHVPTAIWCNPAMKVTEIQGITIVQSRSILINHFWIGVEDDNSPAVQNLMKSAIGGIK